MPAEEKKDKEKSISAKEEEIIIDYDQLDVARIMEQIKRKIASQPRPQPSEKTREERVVIPPPPRSPWELERTYGWRARVKKILLRLMKPVSLLIKLLIFPVYHELRETVLKLHHANMRIDYLSAVLETELAKLSQALNRRIDGVEERFPPIDEEINRLREYTKLLHNLSHNLVVEMSKLKIELDTLKIHHRLLEKDVRHLEQRERWLEKEIVP